jgi:arginine/lysine/ornithine decarboxylase
VGLGNLLRKKVKTALFTTPSHSQKFYILHKLRNIYKYDISETDAYEPQDALLCAEKKAAEIYKTKSTKFLINGSTSGIIGAVLTCTKRNDKVLIWKNAHHCHHNAVKLAGAEPVYYEPEYDKNWGVFTKTNPETIRDNLKNNEIKTVIITSPTYEGFVSDIKEIKKICEEYGAYLIVDEAHGALYPFSEKLPESSVNIADFTVQSLHKTAGGLNPTALLHNNTDLSSENALALFMTTSPSYPLLASVEANINYLNSKRGKRDIENLINNIQELKEHCQNCIFGGDDITKILVKHSNFSGEALSEYLYKRSIEDEKTNKVSTMLLCGIGTTKAKLLRLEKVLKALH